VLARAHQDAPQLRQDPLVEQAMRTLTRPGHRPVAPDLVSRRFSADRPDQLWCGDVT
jgi:transposase InsO family protein